MVPEMNSSDDLDVLWNLLKAAKGAQLTSGLAYLKSGTLTPQEQLSKQNLREQAGKAAPTGRNKATHGD